MGRTALAIGCHPDDIEFMMSGTLMALAAAGCEIHYLNLATGSCGTAELDRDRIVAVRREEARAAAASIGATYHESLADDLEVFFERDLLFRLAAIVRRIAPDLVLTHYPDEYMEDHANTCRLAVTATFARNMRNFPTVPPTPPVAGETVLYHTVPYGLRDPLRRRVAPGLYVDVADLIGRKVAMLACHRSQKDWLDRSQGQDSYLEAMRGMSRELGRQSGRFEYAEGFVRHLHLGFAARADADPLAELLGARVLVDAGFERDLG